MSAGTAIKTLAESGALRQLKHNDGSDGFVIAYDKTITDRYIADLRAAMESAEHQRNMLAQAIADASKKAGIWNGEVSLTGPHLIMFADNLADCAIAQPDSDLIGRKISLDVSTCDDDAGRRIFGTVYEVQDGEILATEDSRNWREMDSGRDAALWEAVAAIYFDDGSKYEGALWNVVHRLSPCTWNLLKSDPKAAYNSMATQQGDTGG